MTWRGLSALVPRLRPCVQRSPIDLELRERAAWVAAAEAVGSDPQVIQARINLAALAIASRCAPPTWLCRPSASAVVHGTDLHSIPTEPPRLLRAPGIVEVRRPSTGERLWGDYASLGWYDVDGATILLGLRYPDGYAVARWVPAWTGEDLDPQLPGRDGSPLIDDPLEHEAFARAAARYLIVLGLLAESDPSPLRIEIDRQVRWQRHVYPGARSSAPRPECAPEQADGKIAELSPVTGHLKRQRYGERNALTKWIYVEGYAARRWRGPRWVVTRRESSTT